MWKTATPPAEPPSRPPVEEGLKLFVFLVRESAITAQMSGNAAGERSYLIVGTDEASASKELMRKIGSSLPVYQFLCVGTFGREEMRRILSPERLEPMQTASALRYAAEEYRGLFDEGLMNSLWQAAARIEEHVLAPMW